MNQTKRNGRDLRIVFMGTPEFATASLKSLVEGGYQVVGVITSPDKPAGRGQLISQSDVKKYALEQGLKILQPERLKNPDFLEELKSLQADLQVVVAFRMLPEVVWAMPSLGTFNLHASLLPQYRGAAPLNWAVINGETKTGVTTFLLDHKIDTGRILFREETLIGENETVGELHDRLMVTGASLVLKTVDALASGNVSPLEQEELRPDQEIRHAPKIFREDCRINWARDAETNRNLIRGLSPYPAAWTNLVNKNTDQETQVKIYHAGKIFAEKKFRPGEILSDGKSYIRVACGKDILEITDLQIAGKKRMLTTEFLKGFQHSGDFFFR